MVRNMGKKKRLNIGPFVNWLVTSLPRCIYPHRKKCSTVGLSKKQRDFVLSSYKFGSYEEYLRSDLWASIRRKVLSGCHLCSCGCGRAAAQVHHRVYSEANLMGESTKGLLGISNGCHRRIEFSGGRKNSLSRANSSLKQCQFDNAAHLDLPTEEEVRMFLSGKHKTMPLERKLSIKRYLRLGGLEYRVPLKVIKGSSGVKGRLEVLLEKVYLTSKARSNV
jgi:hypothetical protein